MKTDNCEKGLQITSPFTLITQAQSKTTPT